LAYFIRLSHSCHCIYMKNLMLKDNMSVRLFGYITNCLTFIFPPIMFSLSYNSTGSDSIKNSWIRDLMSTIDISFTFTFYIYIVRKQSQLINISRMHFQKIIAMLFLFIGKLIKKKDDLKGDSLNCKSKSVKVKRNIV
jgi:hypothetical protein